MAKITCVYKIQSKQIPERVYIGSTVHYVDRICSHRNRLKKGTHNNRFLQSHYNKYGLEDLNFSMVEECPLENLKQREQFYIDTESNGAQFNLDKKVDNHIMGFKVKPPPMTEEHKKNLIEGGRKARAEGRYDNLYKANSGSFEKGMTPWNKGKPHSEEHKENLSKAWEKRKLTPMSDETREKISVANSGEKNPFYGKKHPPEVMERIASKIRGQKHPNKKSPEYLSEDHKRHIREGLLRYYAQKKQENSNEDGN